MCRGEDHGLLDCRTIPSYSIWRNSFLATASFSLSNRQANSGPLMSMWCPTSPEGFLGSLLQLLTTASSCAYLSAPAGDAAAVPKLMREEAGD